MEAGSQFPVGFLGCYAAKLERHEKNGFGWVVSIPCRVSRLLRHEPTEAQIRELAGLVSIPCRVSRLLRHIAEEGLKVGGT